MLGYVEGGVLGALTPRRRRRRIERCWPATSIGATSPGTNEETNIVTRPARSSGTNAQGRERDKLAHGDLVGRGQRGNIRRRHKAPPCRGQRALAMEMLYIWIEVLLPDVICEDSCAF